MGCPLQTLKGIQASCVANLGGIAEAWFGQYTQFNISVDETTHTVSAITAIPDATDAKFYGYEFNRQTGSLTSTITVDEANGVRYYTNVAALQFSRLEAAKHLEIEALAQGQLIGIFHDTNDQYWLVGKDNYMSLTEATAQTGQAWGDLSGYNTTLSQMSAHLPYKLTKADFESFIG